MTAQAQRRPTGVGTMNERVQDCSLTTARPGSRLTTQVVTGQTLDAELTMKGNKADMDGVDHINIDQRGKTELGQQLSHLTKMQFVHPEFGPFQSIEGFIGYIRSGAKDDSFRYLHGMNARFRSRELDTQFIRGFREIVMDANYLKITQNEELFESFKISSLAFDHYYLFGANQRPVRPKNATWIIPAFEELRKELQEGRPHPQVDYSGILEISQ
jgi:hypothetical protein